MAEITLEAQDFIRQHIRAVWQLELLIYFKKCGKPQSVWEASRALQMEPVAAEDCVKSFALKQILVEVEHGRYLFSPAAILSKAIDETERIYSQRRPTVINFIYAQPTGG